MTDHLSPRWNLYRSWPEGYDAVRALDAIIASSGLEPVLLELVKTRSSQINGCAYCIDMHTKDARAMGESEQRLYALQAWRETPFFTPREQAALALTEAVTLVSETHVPDDVVEEAARWFSPEEMSRLTLAIAMINFWNRLAITARMPVGKYVSKHLSLVAQNA